MTKFSIEMWARLAFRGRPEEVARKAALKRDIAVRFRGDREGYTDTRTGCVDKSFARAKPARSTVHERP